VLLSLAVKCRVGYTMSKGTHRKLKDALAVSEALNAALSTASTVLAEPKSVACLHCGGVDICRAKGHPCRDGEPLPLTPQAAVATSNSDAWELLQQLVYALDKTNWSSWQTTHRFQTELDRAREAIQSKQESSHE